MTAAALPTARLLWQMGDWTALSEYPAPVPASASTAPERTELALYRLQALFVTGALDEARALAAALRESGVSRQALARALLSGAGSNLARARLISGQPEAARRNIAAAVALNPAAGSAELVQTLRFETEQKAIRATHAAIPGAGRIERSLSIAADMTGARQSCSC